MSLSLIKSLCTRCTSFNPVIRSVSCVRSFADQAKEKQVTYKKMEPGNRKKASDKRKAEFKLELQKAQELDELALKAGFPKPWKYYAGVVIDREPQVLAPLEDWQVAMQKIWEERYNANTKKVEPIFDLLKEHKVEKKEDDEEEEDINAPLVYETEDDKNKVLTSLNRDLTRYLYLLVNRPQKHPLGKGWALPMAEYIEGEHHSMREVAEGMADAIVGKHMKLYFVGNAPVGYMAHQYSPEDQKKNKCFGYKVYYHRAFIVDGTATINPREAKEYIWVNADSLVDYLEPDTAKYLKRLLD
ncbi:hypothetical protein WA158_001798 [Blastocystis sp. Blastoise]